MPYTPHPSEFGDYGNDLELLYPPRARPPLAARSSRLWSRVAVFAALAASIAAVAIAASTSGHTASTTHRQPRSFAAPTLKQLRSAANAGEWPYGGSAITPHTSSRETGAKAAASLAG